MPDRFRSTRDVILRTERFEEAIRFYESVMGLPVTHRDVGLVGFETGAFQLFVEKGGPSHPPVFEMKVPNVGAARDALAQEGCEVVEENPKVPRCYMRDPFGLVFNLDRS